MKKEVKKFNEFFLNEELEETTEHMENTAQTYSKYKNKVVNSIDPEDIQASQENFEKFISNLPEEEKSASDMLRALFSSEMIKISIEKLESDKKRIEEQISNRIEELKSLQANMK